MLLENKVAVIYGAGGSIGGAVARAFSREGASVFIAGRIQAKLDEVAEDVRANGGVAETAVVDALDEHDLVQKATGWMLRAAGESDRAQLLRFLDTHAAAMPRVTLRYAIEHLDKEQRNHYLAIKVG